MPNIRDDYSGCWTCGKDPCQCDENENNYYNDIPEFKYKTFEGKTVEEAKALAEKNAPPNLNSINITRPVQEKTALGYGNDLDSAIQDAEKSIPENAFAIKSPLVLDNAQSGITVIQAMAESEVQKIWQHGAPDNAVLKECECKSKPYKGIVGFGKKHGIWKVQWQTPVKIGIPYKLPAQVTLSWR
ncbi:hypothetical protein JXQ31_14170 [candidate division KSB1 bacterium]|nr:hypothetical protein [candidate division KSB1 bacterium]